MAASFVIRIGQVESITDEQGGGRIKVRLYDDNDMLIDDLQYAFPLMPKVFSVTPKIGEAVLIFTESLNNPRSQRYYIGPIVSQLQYLEKDNYLNGFGSSASLLTGKSSKPLQNINLKSETTNSFPNQDDVALIGRSSEDIILKNGEINIRCGIRKESDNNNDESLLGKVTFNNLDPAYIQLKYQKNLSSGDGKEANSMINLVADKINLIGLNRFITQKEGQTNLDKVVNAKQFDTFGKDSKNLNELLTNEEISDIMNNAQPAVLGNVLVEILNVLRDAILYHVHPYPGIIPIMSSTLSPLKSMDMSQVKSKNIRLN